MERDSSDAEGEQHFWNELRESLSKHCGTHEAIDDALREWLTDAIDSKGEYVNSEYDIARCSYTLISSPLFESHGEYIRRQIIFGLLQDDEPDALHFAASFLLFDGHEHESTFAMMNGEGAFTRLAGLISSPEVIQDAGLHRLLMDLLYEMGRIQKIHADDLMAIDDNFVIGLFKIIEELSDDVNDPYHYPVIRLLLVLNEQFMVSAHDPEPDGRPVVPLTNKVIKILSSQGSNYKTFGENIILLLNRESMYHGNYEEDSADRVFSTHEYFYTNDLRVLVDILIRNLLDLPEDASALRHTYLRVLYPLLAHTQLRHPPHYKRDEIRKLLSVLLRGQILENSGEDHKHRMQYFEDVDETTKRLVNRCGKVPWLRDEDAESTKSPVEDKPSMSPVEHKKPPPPMPRKLRKRASSKSSIASTEPPSTLHSHSQLGMDLEGARESTLSVLEVAAQREKPGVMTPSRKDLPRAKPPVPPKARRSGWSKKKEENAGEETTISVDAEQSTSPIGITPAETHGDNDTDSKPQPLHPKKPPPMPKARRWRGKLGKDSGSIHTIETPDPSSHIPVPVKSATEPIPRPPPIPVLGSEDREKESVSAALSEIQAQAMNSITESLEKSDINHDNPAYSGNTSTSVTPFLAPPAPAPPRGVRGPEFRVENIRVTGITDKYEDNDDDDHGADGSGSASLSNITPDPGTLTPVIEDREIIGVGKSKSPFEDTDDDVD
ncbi:hypothetical protein UCRPC4_g01172 [Phaeomoniella chlamydospora]|uniref:SPIN90/Ldb17 leucine-rich domain-containing protein n=1 Tax=Phaeomoniella chlamydospora TaxID=158046 RepID=A0A0G2HFM6_PHACM|nr:hypothetical protein UCRPC4_g01172 [Phaeomoniella chlamydospora]